MAQLAVRLFGLPSVAWDEGPLAVSRRQGRALLYRLAAESRPVPREQLIFLFWPDAAEASARRYLSQRLSILRRELPDPDLIRITRDGIRLDSQGAWCDVMQFRQLAGALQQRRRLAALQQARQLYQGPFLSGFSLPKAAEFEQWVLAQRQELERLYLDVLADLVEEQTVAGALQEAVTTARQFLGLDELDESMHGRLIRLYMAVGDRPAALRQYEICAAILERELGVDPLPETQAAYQAALAGEVNASSAQNGAPRLSWQIQPALEVPFIGREDALGQLSQAYRRVQSGQGQVVLVSGEAGIGKTRLVQEFATRLAGRQALVLVGSSQRGASAVPYQPIVEALRSGLELAAERLAGGRGRITLPLLFPGGLAPIWVSEASRLLPELRAMVPNLPAPIEVRDPAAARARLFEALHRLLLALAEPRQVIVLFADDLHWADEATLGWLAYVGGKLRRHRLLVIGAQRQTQGEAISDLRSGLARGQVLQEVVLAHWQRETVEQVLHHVPGMEGANGDRAEMAGRLHEATGGNPFFVLSMLQELSEAGLLDGGWSEQAKLPLPGRVREVLVRRIGRLQPAARQVLEAGAVLGSRLDLGLAQAVSGRSDLETADGLDELVARRLLDSVEPGFQFHHDLLREAAYDSMSGWRRSLLHGRAAEALETRLAAVRAGIRREPDEIEFQEIDLVHLLAEQHINAGQEEQAVAYLFQSGKCADDAYANDEAIAYFKRALAMTTGEDIATRWELFAAMEAVNQRSGHWDAARQDAKEMLALAERSQDPRKQSIALQRLARWRELDGDYMEADRLMRRAIDHAQRAGDVLLEAQARGFWGRILWRQDKIDAGVVQRERQLELARQLGDRHAEAMAVFQLGAVLGAAGDGVQAERRIEQALALMVEIGDRYQTAGVYGQLAAFAFSRGDYEAMETYLRTSERLEQEFGIGSGDWFRQVFRAAVATCKGDLETAVDLYRAALDQLRALGFQAPVGTTLADLGSALAGLGRFDEALALLDQSAKLYEAISAQKELRILTQALLARTLLLMGTPLDALRKIEAALAFVAADQRLYIENGLQVPAICIQVLAANDDSRLDALVTKTHAQMHHIADSFEDAEKRRMFLENVPWHREITAAWEALQAQEPGEPALDWMRVI